MVFILLIVITVVIVIMIAVPVNQTVNAAIEKSKLMMSDPKFANSKKFTGALGHFILVSEQGDIFIHPAQKSFSIIDVNSYKIDINGATQGGLGSAAVGGLLFGGAGAVVAALSANKGKINKISVIFNLDDFNDPTAEFVVLNVEVKENEMLHKSAKETLDSLFATLEYVEKKAKSNKSSENGEL